MTTLSDDWKGDRLLRFPITSKFDKSFDALWPIFENLSITSKGGTKLPKFISSIPDFGIEKGIFLLKAGKKDFTTMRNSGKEWNFNLVFDRLKQKASLAP